MRNYRLNLILAAFSVLSLSVSIVQAESGNVQSIVCPGETQCWYTKCDEAGAYWLPTNEECEEIEGCTLQKKTAEYPPKPKDDGTWSTCTAAALLNEKECPPGTSKRHQYMLDEETGCCVAVTECFSSAPTSPEEVSRDQTEDDFR